MKYPTSTSYYVGTYPCAYALHILGIRRILKMGDAANQTVLQW